MTDRTPLDDVEFLARSHHRVRVLESLQYEARTRAELHDETAISQPTLGRVLGGLKHRNWVEKQNQEYSLTALGQILAEEFEALLEIVESIQELSDVVGYLPLERVDFDLRLLGDATISKPKPNDVLVHTRRAEELLSEADHLRVLTPSIFPAALKKLLSGSSPHHHEAILSNGALEAVQAKPPLVEATRSLLGDDSLDMFRYDGLIPLMLATVDNKALIAPLDKNDLPRALIESENDAIISWVEAQLDEYREASARVTVDELTR